MNTKERTEQKKLMRLQVEDLELKARFWKAQAEIRRYTLEYENLEADYNLYVQKQAELAEELKKKQEEAIARLQEALKEKENTEVVKTEE